MLAQYRLLMIPPPRTTPFRRGRALHVRPGASAASWLLPMHLVAYLTITLVSALAFAPALRPAPVDHVLETFWHSR